MNAPGAGPEALPFVERVYRFDSIASTNTFARELNDAPLAGGLLVIVAARQSAGRGQRDNSFYSDSDSGLWTSIVVQVADIGRHFAVNRALALAACEAACAAGVDARIKWPNDIVVNGRKLAGMLLESVSSAPGRIVAGLGMNINTEACCFPADIRDIATSLAIESAVTHAVDEVLTNVLRHFERWRHEDDGRAHERYRTMLAGVGHHVRVGDVAGEFAGVDAQGRAVLHCGKEERYFSSGPMRFDT